MRTVIVGGGLSGMTLGFLLRKLGKEVIVIEASAAVDESRAMVLTDRAIKSISLVFGEKIWEKVRKTEFSQATVWYEPDRYEVVPAKVSLAERGELVQYFRDAYVEEGGDLLFSKAIGVDEKEKLVRLSDLGEVRYEYLVVADGADSLMREVLELDEKRVPLMRVRQDYINDEDGNSVVKDISEMVPSGKDVKLFHSYNIAYIGEAAGFADPISGEVASYALKTAEEMAVSIHNNGFDGATTNDFYGLYAYHLVKEVKKRRTRKIFKMRSMLRKELFANA